MEPIPDLLPEVPRPQRRFEVSVSVPLEAARDCPVPGGYPRVPAGLLGGWMRDQVTVGGEVRASGMLEALVVTAAMLGDWLEVPGAELRVQPATAGEVAVEALRHPAPGAFRLPIG